jgi:UDP-N-acetylmuramate dehydrogenase
MVQIKKEADLRLLPGMTEQVQLAPFTTLRIGGPARYFLRAETVEDLQQALDWATRHHLPVLILGGGSNMLVADEGFPGLVVHIQLRGIKVGRERDFIVVDAAAGEDWDQLVAFTVENNLGGMECLSGIPGLVGATPIQNVGAYGQDVSQIIVDVKALDRQTGSLVTLSNAECEFEYRQSRFKGREPNRFVILSVRYRLLPAVKPCTLYPDVQRYLEQRGLSEPNLAEAREAVISIRRTKAMVVDPEEPDSRSAGSFFTNPILTDQEHHSFLERARARGLLADLDRVPTYPAGPGRVKLSAAWLIERAGFRKGWTHGNVGISGKHTLAIVNRGGGTAREVRELVSQIQEKVAERFGVPIVPEPNFVGFSAGAVKRSG